MALCRQGKGQPMKTTEREREAWCLMMELTDLAVQQNSRLMRTKIAKPNAVNAIMQQGVDLAYTTGGITALRMILHVKPV